MTVINGIMGIEYLIGNAVTASLGKMLREEEKSKVYRFYLVYQYAQFLFSAFCTVGIAVVSKSFITWWVGERFLIDKVCLVLLVVDFFVHSMYQPAYVMFGAAGKFRDDKIITLASAVMNIVISIGLVFVIGLPGVIVGTLVTDLYIWGVRSYQVVRSFFGENLGRYAGKMVKYILLTTLGMVISMKISSLVQMESLLGTIAIHVLICVAVPNAVSLLGTLGSEEFRFLYGIAGKALRRKRGNL